MSQHSPKRLAVEAVRKELKAAYGHLIDEFARRESAKLSSQSSEKELSRMRDICVKARRSVDDWEAALDAALDALEEDRDKLRRERFQASEPDPLTKAVFLTGGAH